MARSSPDWMWAEAVAVLARAECPRDRFPSLHARSSHPVWEPPVDVFETDDAVVIVVALPGVEPGDVGIELRAGAMFVSGRRVSPFAFPVSVVHRLELPQGHFERAIPIPPGRYDGVETTARNGCLSISLRKATR